MIKRILIIENSVDVTGALISILRSSKALRNSFEFYFILPHGSAATEYVRQQGFPVEELPMKEVKKDIFALAGYVPFLLVNTIRVTRMVKRLNVDLVVNNDFYNLIPAVYKLFGGSTPYLTYVRFRPLRFPSMLVRIWCGFHHRFAAAVIAVSESVRKELPFQRNVVLIGNELPDEDVLYSRSDSTTILYPANYIQGKGQEYALRSFAALHQDYPQWKLRFVGSDMGLQKNHTFKISLKNEAVSLGIAHKIEWCNFSKNLAQEYVAASIVLNFSESESFSLTCLEAMFYGRVVIATRSGGPEEIIEEGTGYLVGLADVEAMTHAMRALMTDAEKRESMSREAFNSVRKRYGYANTIGKLGDLYGQILGRN
ncbi:MAG: glycosyltransferase family 4 protein [Cyclobacteriaceae bacterium]|nr:glycosyltransferase family 4 protein [Cyclobacteriaceae bacterium]